MHTEGKWTVKREGNFDTISIESNIKSDSNLFKHDVICIFSKPNREANAKRIVQAVNSFDDLLEALKAFVTEYDNLPKEEAQGLIGRIQKLFTNARRAIAQAGKPE